MGPEAETEAKGEVEVTVKTELEVDKEAASSAAAEATAEDLFDALLEGLGISRVELHPTLDRAEIMLTAGQVLREYIHSATDLLSNRVNLKIRSDSIRPRLYRITIIR